MPQIVILKFTPHFTYIENPPLIEHLKEYIMETSDE